MKHKFLLIPILLFSFQNTYAFSGEAADSVADFMSWVVLILLPIGGIYLFWQAHIYPEKVAEERNHPQLNAIKAMCLLSLIFGGLLWPVALIWAYYNYNDKEKQAEQLNTEQTNTENSTEESI